MKKQISLPRIIGVGFIFILILFLSYFKDSYVLSLSDGFSWIVRNDLKYTYTTELDTFFSKNTTRFISGILFLLGYLILFILGIWIAFGDKRIVLVFSSIFLSLIIIISLLALVFGVFGLVREGYILASKCKEFVLSPLFFLLSLIVFYIYGNVKSRID